MKKPMDLLRTPTILVVDDTLDVLRLLSSLLIEWGYESWAASNGRLAVKAVQTHSIDLVLLDIIMPEMSGYEVCRILKADEKFREIPIIFLSGLSETVNKVEGFSIGAVDFVAKPIDPAELQARIKTHLSIHRMKKEMQELNNTLEERVVIRTNELLRANAALQKEIEERKYLEKSLKEGHEKYRLLFESMTEGFALHEVLCNENGAPIDYRFLEMNPSFERLTGLQANKVVGKTWLEVFPDSDPSWVETYGNVALSGRPITYEQYFSAIDRYFQIAAFCPTRGKFAVIISDITSRKIMEESLQESEEKYRALVENASDIIMRFDRNFCYLYISPAVKNIFGVSSEDILGKPHRKLGFSDEQCKFFESNLDKVFQSKQSLETEFEISSPCGPIQMDWRLFPEFNENGEVSTILGIARNITDQKMARELLIASNDQLHVLMGRLQAIREEEKTRIARQVHDELGQILTALKIDVSWFETRIAKTCIKGEKEKKQALERVSQTKILVDEAIRSVRQISQELHSGIIDDLGLIPAIQSQLKTFQERTGAVCVLTNTLDSFEFSKTFAIAMFRILQESLTNIARHADASEVKVSLQTEKEFIIMEIRDNGRGIAEANLRFPTSLGIMGMQERAREFGGNVEIEGASGQGTIVRVCMPEREAKK